MKVIANEASTLIAAVGISKSKTLNTTLDIYKDSLYDVDWFDEISEEDVKKAYNSWEKPLRPLSSRKSFINIKVPDGIRSVELTRKQFEKYFSPIEDHSKLHFYRIDLTPVTSNTDKCILINKFIQNPNIKIDKIFEPDSNTIDIWYTKYIGEW